MSHESNLSFLDTPEILDVVFPIVYSPFHFFMAPAYSLPDTITRFIEVEQGIKIVCGFWVNGKELPTILYFHGNGEKVTDYNEIARFYIQRDVNLFVADYRGYGLSQGRPNITNMIRDAHSIFKGFGDIIKKEGYDSNIFLMGRSLGSISAVEIAYHYQDQLKGLIIESGTSTNFNRMWKHLVISEEDSVSSEKFLNRVKLKSITIPTLIIHGEYDQIIPVQEGLELYEKSGSVDKDILIISGAGHNDLMLRGHEEYFNKIEEFINENS